MAHATRGTFRILASMVAAAALTGPRAAEGAEGLVAHYAFDEGSGAGAGDRSPRGRDGAIHGAAWVSSPRGQALSFDGKQAYVDLGPTERLGLQRQVTLCLWLKPGALPPDRHEPVLLGEQPRSCALTYYRGRVYFYFGHFSNRVACPVAPGRWRHVAATADGDAMKLYVDGRLRVQRPLPPEASVPAVGAFAVGANPAAKWFFNGLIDDVRVYDRALSAAQIELLVRDDLAALVRAREQQATRFFQHHRDPIDLEAHEDRLLFANRRVGLEFRRTSQGFHIARLYSIQHDQDFLTSDAQDTSPNLLQIVTVLDRGRARGRYSVAALSAKSSRFARTDLEGQATLHLRWDQVDLREDRDAMDVEVAVTLKADDPLTYWRFRIANRSQRYGMWRVYFPVLRLAPIGEPQANAYVYPQDRGRLALDPFHQPPGYGDGVHRSGRYPAAFGMQFQALYNERTGVGLYLGTQDPVPRLKNTEAPNTADHITWKPGHFPANMGCPAEDYALPYDCVVGPFTGDWWDACQIYRQWALEQTWCRRGPLAQRRDVPTWYKEAPLFLTCKSHCQDSDVAAIRDSYLKYLHWAGVALPCQWYAWKQYSTELTAYDLPTSKWSVKILGHPCSNVHDGNYPKLPALPSFAAACQELRRRGGFVLPYVCLQIYDQGRTENAPYVADARPHVVHDVHGRPCTYGREPSWAMCVWTDWWRNRVKETCVTMLEREHAGGFYLDTMHGAGEHCFRTEHGHSACGGRALPMGMHGIAECVRDAIKETDPEAITTGEDPAENMIDAIDGKLYQHTLTPNSRVPLFAAVYQDYVLRYGMSVVPDEGHRFYAEAASLFVEGAQMGRIHIGPGKWRTSFDDPAHRPMLEFLGRLVAYYRRQESRDFLCYGQLMRPLRFRRPSPMPTLSLPGQRGRYKGRVVELPALFSGVFRSQRGELAAFVVNASGQPLSYAAEMDLRRYRVGADARVQIDAIPAVAAARPMGTAKGKALLEGKLGPRQATMYRLRVMGRGAQ